MSYYDNDNDVEWFEDEEKESALRKRLDELDWEDEHALLDRMDKDYFDSIEFEDDYDWDSLP